MFKPGDTGCNSLATMQTPTQINAVLSQLADLLDEIPPGAGEQPTPCTEFTLAQLRQHVVGWLTAFSDGYADPDGRCSDAEQVEVHGTGSDQVHAAAQRLSTALAVGAADRPVRIGDAEMPGGMALQMMLWEYQVHGWDLARAIGQPWQPAEDGLLASLEFAPAMLTADFQGEGKAFAPRVEVPEDADPLTRLLALSGRDPR